MTKCKDMPKCSGCPMLAVDYWYENKDEGKVHFQGGENNFIPPQLGSTLRLAVTDAPEFEDSLKGTQLSGGSGRAMNRMYRMAGIKTDSLHVINTIQCRPPDDIYPSHKAAGDYISPSDGAKAVEQCYRNYVVPLLAGNPWDRIDALGEESLRLLTGKTDGVMKWRGSPLPLVGTTEPKVIATVPPSMIMKAQYLIPAIISDLRKGTQVPPETYNLHPTVQDLIDFRSETFCYDIETNRFTNQITMVGLSFRPYHVIVVPFQGAYVDELKRIFRNAKHVIGQNIIGFDNPRMATAGCVLNPEAEIWDIMLMQHLLQPDADHDLEYISSIFTQKPAWKHLASDNMPLYCARDVDVTLQAYNQLKPLLAAMQLEDLYKYTQVPLEKICRLMQNTGIVTDGSRIDAIREKKLAEVAALEPQLPPELAPYDKAIKVRVPAPEGTLGKSGKPVKFLHVPSSERVRPYNSDKVVKDFFYRLRNYPEQKNSKTLKVTVDKKAMERLFRRTKDPAIPILQKLNKLNTLISGFLKENKHARGKVHSHISVVGTGTGRLSSADPNMQNQPPDARFVFIPSDPEWCFVEADFSSGENRLTALYAHDHDRLRRLATPGFNEHKLNASIFFGIPVEEIEKDNDPDKPYGKGKKINHGMNYGEGARKIAQDNDLDEKEVKEAIHRWKLANPLTVSWQDRTTRQAEREGVLTNAFGRKRWFWTTNTYTESLAFLPQSTLADIIFKAMIGLMYERIELAPDLALKASSVLAPLPMPARLLLQVHDSLLVECPKDSVGAVIKAMKATMEQSWTQLGGYVIPVEFKVGGPGESWGEVKAWKE